MSSKTTKTTSKGKQALIEAEDTPITKVLNDSTDTGLFEELDQSQHTEATESRLNNNPRTNPGLFSTDETKQSKSITFTPEMMSQLMAQFSFINKENLL